MAYGIWGFISECVILLHNCMSKTMHMARIFLQNVSISGKIYLLVTGSLLIKYAFGDALFPFIGKYWQNVE